MGVALLPTILIVACASLKDGSTRPDVGPDAGPDAAQEAEAASDASMDAGESGALDAGESGAPDTGADGPTFPPRPLGAGVAAYAITPLGSSVSPTLWTLPSIVAPMWRAVAPVPDAASAPTSVSWTRMRTDVFYATAGGSLAHTYTDDFGATYHPIDDWGTLPGYKLLGRPDATSWSEGRIDVMSFAQPAAGGSPVVVHAMYDATIDAQAVTWDNWNWPPASDGSTLTAASNPTATAWSVGRLDVFFIGSDQQLWHRYFEVPGTPTPTAWTGLSNDNITLGDNLDGVARTADTIDLQTMSPGHTIEQWFWPPAPGQWRDYLDGMPTTPAGGAVLLGPLSLARTGTDGYVIAGVDDQSPSVWTQQVRIGVHPSWVQAPAPPSMPHNGIVEVTAW